MTSFYVSALASFAGHSMFGYAAVIYTQERTGSELLSGTVFFCMNAPLIFLGYLAGTIADRSSRRRILLLATAACAACAIAVGALELASGTAAFLVLEIAALTAYGLAFAFVPPARFALLGDLTSGRGLESSTVVLTVLNLVGFAVGPAIVGATLEAGGWLAVFGALAAVWAVAGLALLPLSVTSAPRDTAISTAADLRAGVSFIASSPAVWQLCLVTLLFVVLTFGPYQVLVPALGREALALSEAQRGSLMSAFGGGLIVGGVASGALMRVAQRGFLILGATAATALGIAAVPLAPSAPWMALCLGTAGVFAGVVAALIPATLQAATPDAYRGRVMSLQAMILGGFPAVGAMLAGGLAETLGVRNSIHLAGAVGAAAVASMAAAFPVLRGLRAAGADTAAYRAELRTEPTREP